LMHHGARFGAKTRIPSQSTWPKSASASAIW
jgi:hypothetical protein